MEEASTGKENESSADNMIKQIEHMVNIYNGLIETSNRIAIQYISVARENARLARLVIPETREPMCFAGALMAMDREDAVAQAGWPKGAYIYKTNGRFRHRLSRGNLSWVNFFSAEEILATNWVIIEKPWPWS